MDGGTPVGVTGFGLYVSVVQLVFGKHVVVCGVSKDTKACGAVKVNPTGARLSESY